ncbi:GNAT family N-acetyltransferase [Pseudomonas soli]|jgi:putative acetyltransferase|uniref:Putative acetyltransferase n=1 Tax=Pseudomonas soli TaxID=1306993 RepID=A0A1H9KKP6_9PSED|nr:MULTISPECIES: GNAT family N-acetyltransferase [Pseudomonas]AUY36611.1 GNAT family N-acetyltransferase [Pseudomonas sp. PONIH3]MDT3717109.1 GNAT family N-acetyltransferase [Pseudomonas soli]MDT3733780.1 GNAT family N-acetyltransferase [Pseudomonas soli]SEQ99678.1 putative acetyltransferase [Pseudomonas soli]
MNFTIAPVGAQHYDRLADLWEASVRATHDFLPAGYIEHLRPLVREQYLGFVQLRAWSDIAGYIQGFAGVHEGKLEMLFVDPACRGQGIGKSLLAHVIDELGVREVDVNEQNPQAVGFYLRHGFVQVGRSEVDGQGDPFPLLHLKRVG